MIRIAVGGLIVLAVFGAIFSVTAKQLGCRVAAGIWAVALAVTGLMVGAVWLISSGLA